jgi:predicted secreted Zn-dependent protease
MGCMRLLLEVALACTPGVEVDEQVQYYAVHGRTPTELTESMALNGPRHPRGRNAWGLTEWDITAHYELRQEPDRCEVVAPSMTLTLRIVLPQWQRPTQVDPRELPGIWKRAQVQMIGHEQQHRAHAHAGAARMLRNLQALPSSGSCAEADRRAQAAIREANAWTRSESLAFDTATRYGAENGITPGEAASGVPGVF